MTESAGSQYTQNDVLRGLIDLIDTTANLERNYQAVGEATIGGARLAGSEVVGPMSISAAIDEGKVIINATLANMRGITVRVRDEDTGQSTRYDLLQWQGVDPLDAGQHLWHVGMDGVSVRPLSRDILDEIRSQL